MRHCAWNLIVVSVVSTLLGCNDAFQIHSGSSKIARQQTAPVNRRNVLIGGIMGGVVCLTQPAFAERSMETVTQSYKRYVPRMETGFEFLGNGLKEMIEAGDKDGVLAEVTAEKGTKISAMKGTMKIFATAFSDSVVTQATRELQLATLKTSEQLEILASAMTSGDTNGALEAHQRAVFFAQIYAETANGCLPRSLDKISGPKGVATRIREQDAQNGAF